mmetsp:Transcript_16342/g.33198  ORF Transcript_16342/g.33198 Transcript_16342/m.33198 type:complete len:237 (-) Transcript_16342:346-1056(-)
MAAFPLQRFSTDCLNDQLRLTSCMPEWPPQVHPTCTPRNLIEAGHPPFFSSPVSSRSLSETETPPSSPPHLSLCLPPSKRPSGPSEPSVHQVRQAERNLTTYHQPPPRPVLLYFPCSLFFPFRRCLLVGLSYLITQTNTDRQKYRNTSREGDPFPPTRSWRGYLCPPKKRGDAIEVLCSINHDGAHTLYVVQTLDQSTSESIKTEKRQRPQLDRNILPPTCLFFSLPFPPPPNRAL